MFSTFKALVDSEKFRGAVFKYSKKNNNLELGIFTFKHDSTCHRKIASYRFMYRAKTDNSEPGYRLTGNSETFEFSENVGVIAISAI